MTPPTPFAAAVHVAVSRIPHGTVASYGDIAALVGHPRAARGVGRVLRELPENSRVPWWRVIAGTGTISNPGPAGQLQALLLIQEGVAVRGRRVDMRRFRWRGPPIRSRRADAAAKPTGRKPSR